MVFRKETIPGTKQQDKTSHPSLRVWLFVLSELSVCSIERRIALEKNVKMSREQKDRQIRREAKATLILFLVCFIWNVGFAYGLSGTGIRVMGLPLWWLISTPGMFVLAVIGVVYMLKKVFVNFDLEEEEEGGAADAE